MPITMLWAGLCGLLVLVLTVAVIRQRVAANVLLGTGDDPKLTRLIRAHGNAVEFIPLCLILLFLLEAAGHAHWLLHVLGAALFVGRALHGYGLATNAGTSVGRAAGAITTILFLLVAGGLCVYDAIQLL